MKRIALVLALGVVVVACSSKDDSNAPTFSGGQGVACSNDSDCQVHFTCASVGGAAKVCSHDCGTRTDCGVPEACCESATVGLYVCTVPAAGATLKCTGG